MSDRGGSDRRRLILPTARGGPTRMASSGGVGVAAGARPRMLKPKGEGGSFQRNSPGSTPPSSNPGSFSKSDGSHT